MREKQKGFTLIELLVVIVIIAILAAILFPIFARAKAQARVSTCQSNEHQIFTALTLYADSYDGRMPDCASIEMYIRRAKVSDLPDPREIHSLLLKYAGKNKNIFKCPSDVIVPPIDGSGNYNWSARADLPWKCTYVMWGSSYQWNLRKSIAPVTDPADNYLSGVVISARSQPSRDRTMRDGLSWHFNGRGIDQQDRLDTRGASNVLYLDGHVKFEHGDEYHGIF